MSTTHDTQASGDDVLVDLENKLHSQHQELINRFQGLRVEAQAVEKRLETNHPNPAQRDAVTRGRLEEVKEAAASLARIHRKGECRGGLNG